MRQRYAKTSGLASQALNTGGNTIITVIEDYVMSGANQIVLVDTSAGPVSITLPSAAAVNAQTVTVKKVSGAEAVSVSGDANIDGEAVVQLNTVNISLTFVSTGDAWRVI